VRVLEPGADLLGDVDGHVDRRREIDLARALEHAKEIAAIDELHRDVVGLGDSAEVEDLRDVGVLQLYDDLGLVDEHADEALVLREVRVNDLEREELFEAADAARLGQIDLGHSSNSDLFDEPVWPEAAWLQLFGS
jgi:hypothetical protein